MNRLKEIPEVPFPDPMAFSRKANNQMKAIENVFCMTPDEVEDNRLFPDMSEWDQSSDWANDY